MKLNRALGKVPVLVREVARDFSQVHRSNSTLTLLLNGIPCGLLWMRMLLFSPVLITFWSFRQFFHWWGTRGDYWLKGSYAPASENTTLRNRQNPSLSINDYCHYQCRPRCGHITDFTHWQIAVAHGEGTVFVTYFPKFALGKFPWIRQKEQKNFPWQLT